MKRMRKGIVVMVVAAAGVIGGIGAASGAQASTTPVKAVVVRGEMPMPQAMGSSWQ